MNKITKAIEQSEKEFNEKIEEARRDLFDTGFNAKSLLGYPNQQEIILEPVKTHLRQSQINLIEEIVKLLDQCESLAKGSDEWTGFKCLKSTLQDSIKEIKSNKKK